MSTPCLQSPLIPSNQHPPPPELVSTDPAALTPQPQCPRDDDRQHIYVSRTPKALTGHGSSDRYNCSSSQPISPTLTTCFSIQALKRPETDRYWQMASAAPISLLNTIGPAGSIPKSTTVWCLARSVFDRQLQLHFAAEPSADRVESRARPSSLAFPAPRGAPSPHSLFSPHPSFPCLSGN